MCIIIYKDCGVAVPSEKILSTCLKTHKDGFGAMWREESKIFITKGLYNLEGIKQTMALIPKDTEAAFHFRMATHGGVKAGNCHPFPLCSRNDALTSTSGYFEMALMHNGIITDFGTRAAVHSDTMNFVKYLEKSTKRIYTFDRLKHLIKDRYGKFIIFSPEYTYTFGSFFEDKGLKYSNTTYKDFDNVWGCNHKYTERTPVKGTRFYPIVKEVMNPQYIKNIGGDLVEFLGCYGIIIKYRNATIFAERGYSHLDLQLVKEDIDMAILEGEYEGLKNEGLKRCYG